MDTLLVLSSAHFPPERFDHTKGPDAGPDGNRHKFGPPAQIAVRHLRKRIIELRAHFGLIIAGEPPMPDMTHHADHPYGIGTQTDPEVLSYGLPSAESLLRHNVIDHRDGFIPHPVLVIEEPALEQRDAHDLQIIRRHAAGQHQRFLVLRRRIRSGPVADLVVALAHRDGIDHRNGLHSWYAGRVIENILPCRTYLRRA